MSDISDIKMMEPIYFAPQPKLGGGWVCYKDSPSPPAAPDYTGAAEKTAAGNLDLARLQTKANRYTEITPLGTRSWQQGGGQGRVFDAAGYNKALDAYASQLEAYKPTSQQIIGYNGDSPIFGDVKNNAPAPVRPNQDDYWTPGGDQDQWTSTITLSPLVQDAMNSQQRISGKLGGIGEGMLDRVSSGYGQEFPTGSLPAVAQPSDATRSAMADALMARLEPRFSRDEEALRTRLYNMGAREGSEAWKNAMDDLTRSRNDARLGAEAQAGNEMARQYGLEADARSRAIQEAAYLRGLPLSELNALRTGSQPTLPSFGAAGQMPQVAGPNYLGAAQQQYGSAIDAFNVEQAGAANQMNGLLGLGRLGLSLYTGGMPF